MAPPAYGYRQPALHSIPLIPSTLQATALPTVRTAMSTSSLLCFVNEQPALPLLSLVPAGDIFAYCSHRLPRFHPISISGYHMQAGRVACLVC